MTISSFFQNTLGANLNNQVWSWGAFNPTSNRLFLRVWENNIEDADGIERVLVLRNDWDGKSNGFPERKQHIELLKNGSEGFGVVCTAVDTTAKKGSWKIAKFDEKTLLQFGGLIDDGERVYASVVGRIPVAQLRQTQTGYSTLLPDLQAIANKKSGPTSKQALATARLGQGAFRSQVLNRWNGRCAVTGTQVQDAIRASHIKPWRDSNDIERLDPDNGLPLIATVDALFDAGLISFLSDGTGIVSSILSAAERKILRTDDLRLTRNPNPPTAKYLEYHRDSIFRQL